MRVSNAAAPQVVAVARPVVGAVKRYHRSLTIAMPAPSSHEEGRARGALVALVLLKLNAPGLTAVAVPQLSFAGTATEVLKVSE